MIIADGSFFVVNHSNQINSCNACPDISDHFEQAHSHGTEDYMALNEPRTKTTQFFRKTDFNSTIEVSFKNNFIFTIWQPPKIS